MILQTIVVEYKNKDQYRCLKYIFIQNYFSVITGEKKREADLFTRNSLLKNYIIFVFFLYNKSLKICLNIFLFNNIILLIQIAKWQKIAALNNEMLDRK